MDRIDEKYGEYLSVFINKTKESVIVWKQDTQSSFYYETKNSKNEKVVIALQKVAFGIQIEFIFLVTNMTLDDVILKIGPNVSPYIKEKLATLYTTILYEVEKKSFDQLDDILGNI
jgi:hypothetical protein